jgi:hypothetical protein
MRVRFLTSLLLACVTTALALAVPPQLEIPAEVKATGFYVRFTPKTDADSVIYVGLDGIEPFPSDELRDPRRFLMPVMGLKAGRYKFAAVGAKGGEQTRVDFVVVIGDVPPIIPPVIPPVIPPAAKGKVFVVVLQDRLTATPNSRDVLASAAFRSYLTTNGYELDLIDTGSPTGSTRAAPFRKIASAAPFNLTGTDPVVILVDAGSTPPGLVLSATKLPDTDAALVSFIKTVTGK